MFVVSVVVGHCICAVVIYEITVHSQKHVVS